MNQSSYAEISKMLNAFPRSTGNIEALLLTFDEDLAGISDKAVQETARRFRQGSIPAQSKKFAPSTAEFREAAVNQEKIISAIEASKALPSPSKPQRQSETRGPSPFELRRERELAKFAGWRVFKENVSYEEFRVLSQRREIPVGATWCAFLATIYVPPVE